VPIRYSIICVAQCAKQYSDLVKYNIYTVPKAFSMHETFPKLLGNISKTTWRRSKFPSSFGNNSC
jgi:hypothetical protein